MTVSLLMFVAGALVALSSAAVQWQLVQRYRAVSDRGHENAGYLVFGGNLLGGGFMLGLAVGELLRA